MDMVYKHYRIEYNPYAHFPLYDFLSSYVSTQSSWNQEILNKVLSGQAKPIDYSLFPWYILDSNLPQTNMEGGPIYYASGEQFGTLLGYWQGPTGMAARQYLQGAYVSINENFTKH